MSTITIGILGGMGPRATVFFEQLLLERFSGLDQSLPRIVSINDGQVPDRTQFLTARGADPVPLLTKNISLLEQAGVDIICMPCNTAHAPQILLRLLQQPVPILDMPQSALDNAKLSGYNRVLILGTQGTVQSGVYDSRARGVNCIYPGAKDQKAIDNIIAQVKAGQPPAAYSELLQDISSRYSVDATILACTELSMVHVPKQTGPVIDALESLVNECILAHNRYNGRED